MKNSFLFLTVSQKCAGHEIQIDPPGTATPAMSEVLHEQRLERTSILQGALFSGSYDTSMAISSATSLTLHGNVKSRKFWKLN